MSHTAIVLVGGLLLLAAIYGAARWRGVSLRHAFLVFAALWAVAAAVNLWVGVAHAGYSLAEELPIFVFVYGIPTLIAWLWARRSA